MKHFFYARSAPDPFGGTHPNGRPKKAFPWFQVVQEFGPSVDSLRLDFLRTKAIAELLARDYNIGRLT